MQTSYSVNMQKAIAGLVLGRPSFRPAQIAKLKQITQVRFTTGGSETTNVVLTVVDQETGQTYVSTSTGSSTYATMLDNMLAAFRLHAELNSLFTATEDGVDDFVMTARHGGRAYTVTATGGPSLTPPAVSNLQASGGVGLPFGTLVAQGTLERTFAQLGATSTINDILGALQRTDGNHFHDIPDVFGAEDLSPVGKEMSIVEDGRIWLHCEEAMAVGDPVYVRRAQTSGAGRIGAIRKTPAGTAQTVTITPVADMLVYGFEFGYLGRHYSAIYSPTDGTTAVADAIDGLVVAVGTIAGITVNDNSTTMTLVTAAGTEFDYVRVSAVSLDNDTPTVAIVVGAADVDTILISDIAAVDLGGSDLALVKLKIQK